MANALKPQLFTRPQVSLGPIDPSLVKVRLLIKSALASEGSDGAGVAPLYDVSGIPWNCSVTGVGGDTTPVYATDVSHASDAVDTATATIGTISAALATIKTNLGLAQTALDAALATAKSAEDAFDLTRAARWKALTRLKVATAGGNAATIAAAQAHLNEANAAKASAQTTLDTANADVTDKTSTRNDWQFSRKAAGVALKSAQAVLDDAILKFTLVSANFEASGGEGDSDPEPYTSYSGGGGDDGVSSAGATVAYANYSVDAYGSEGPQTYVLRWSSGQYCFEVRLSDAFYQAAKGQGAAVRLNAWLVTWTYPNVTNSLEYLEPGEGVPTITPLGDDFLTLAIDGATQDDATGEWVLRSAAVSVDAPDPGTPDAPSEQTLVTLTGPPVLPSSAVEHVQYCGAQRYLQGWVEFTTTDGQQPRYYLTQTASASEAAPEDADYSGSLAYSTPDDDHPAEGEDKPLALFDSLSDDVGDAVPGSSAATVPTDGATITSPTVRELDDPKGLILTLTDEQTTGDIQGEVTAAVTATWPEPTEEVPYPPALPHVDFEGAMRYVSRAGNRAVGQKMRFKLRHLANDTRALAGSTFSTTHYWRYKRRNIDTGEVTFETNGKTKVLNWTQEVGNTVQERVDAAWTEIPAPAENETVELEMLPGANAEPHTFGAMSATLVTASED